MFLTTPVILRIHAMAGSQIREKMFGPDLYVFTLKKSTLVHPGGAAKSPHG